METNRQIKANHVPYFLFSSPCIFFLETTRKNLFASFHTTLAKNVLMGEISSTVKPANNNYGAVFYFKGEKDLAAQYFMKEIRLHPNNLDPYQNMGVYYRDKGQPDKAVPYWQKLIQMNKYYTTAYEDLLKYYSQIHDTESKKLLERYVTVKAEMENKMKRIQ